jgi:hypothetical protein
MTKEEQENHAKIQAESAVRKAEEEAAAQADAEAKASAITKLTVLGLTVDEVKAILK